MKLRLVTAIAIVLFLGGIASAHRLDEYLQATIFSVEKDHVQASMRLIPGVAVSSAVIASIDSNGDGRFSESEQMAYADRVLEDLFLAVDGNQLKPKLVLAEFPTAELMSEGLGEIHIEYTADFPRGGRNRRLVLENRHQMQNSAYLVNCLVPNDHDIQIVGQRRNEQQSVYEVDYVQAVAASGPPPLQWWTNLRGALTASGFSSLFRLGLRHIAEGTDHLLFLLALLLPAPLICFDSRWTAAPGLRRSVARILKIVTAFTLGHSVTLALAAWGHISQAGRPVEVLIAISILVSALHALRPIFPGKEAGIAASFGLIHGWAFAATLSDLGLAGWERVFGILAFNLGIETMQLLVVAITMPSLVIMSRTRAYPFVRISGALFAGLASTGWIVERLFGVHSSVDIVVEVVSRHVIWIAGALFLASVGCLLLRKDVDSEDNPAA
jgi:hypothetical protein